MNLIAKQRFFDMVSARLKAELVHTNYTLGTPRALEYGPNTEIDIKPLLESHLYFNRVMRYQRGILDGIFRITVNKNDSADLYGLLDQINDEPIFQLNIRRTIDRDYNAIDGIVSIDDVYNVELPAFGYRKYVDIPMRAKPESLFLTGAMLIRVMNNQ